MKGTVSMEISMTLRRGEVEEELNTICWITIFQHFPWNEEGKRGTGLRRKSCNWLAGHRTWEPLVDYSAGYRVVPLTWDLQNTCAKDAPPIHSRILTGKANRIQKKLNLSLVESVCPGFQSERLTWWLVWVCTQPAKLTCPALDMKMQAAYQLHERRCSIEQTRDRRQETCEQVLHHVEM